MRVLVTGGSGFVGANVVRALLARGDEVRCVVRDTSPGLALDGLDVERVVAPLTDAEALRRALDGVEGAYHVAGSFDPGPGGEARMRAIHVDATRALLDAAAAVGVRRVVLCSSSITLGFGSKEAPGDEDTPLDVDATCGRHGPLRAYHDTKREAERLAAESRVETVIVNPDYCVGPWDLKPTSGALILQVARGRMPVWPRGGKCFVDVADVAAGHLLAMDRGAPGRRYLLGNENLSYREFLALVADVVGRRGPVAPLPRTATGALGLVGRLATRVSPHAFAGLDPWVLRSMQGERYRSPARAVRELGLPRTPVRHGVETAWAWFRDHGRLRP